LKTRVRLIHALHYPALPYPALRYPALHYGLADNGNMNLMHAGFCADIECPVGFKKPVALSIRKE
jgi:hypothetical protein